jgi:TonB-linked SusC/RagA family outer membrane protein
MHLQKTALFKGVCSWRLRTAETKKLLLAMKLTAILLLAACMQVSARGDAQTVSISVKNASLEKVFQEVKKQTGYTFFYKAKDLDNTNKISVSVKNASIEEVLNICFKEQPLTYTIIEKTILIKKKEKSPNEEAAIINEPPPPIDITGKVTDADGNPLAGASVKVKGSSSGTTTNNDGVFVLKGVDENATLEISFVGYETYTVAVNNKSTIVASLKVKPESLGEVVINKGYYTEKQRFSVANVAKVVAKDIEKQPVSNLLLALEGRVPGLLITQNSGVPGGGIKVRIQGQNSIRYGNEPFYVIDGVPFPSYLPPTASSGVLGSSGVAGFGNAAGGNPLSYINPSDIESIEVLKDADATAIYGSRAANGAILITTKKGKIGKPSLTVNFKHGWGEVTRLPKMMNRRQYLDMRYEALKNDGIDINTISSTSSRYYDLKVWDTTRSTDWQKELLGHTANYTNVNATFSGGTALSQYIIGGTYYRETTVFPGDFSDQKASIHFNLNSKSLNNRFNLQFSGSYLADHNKLPGLDLTSSANLLEPVAPALYTPDGNLNWAPTSDGTSTWDNPLAVNLTQYQNQTSNLIGNALLGYKILTDLEIKTSLGYNQLFTNDFIGAPLPAYKPEDRPFVERTAEYGSRLMNSWIIEPHLDYSKNWESSKLSIVIGSTVQQTNSKANNVQGSGYASDEVLENMMAATTLTAQGSTIAQYKYNAAFGRLNYNWGDKYIINISGRRDGSSRFGDKNKFHNFGSLGSAWIFTEERFVKHLISFLSFGKIRGSYGTTGNDQIGEYTFLSRYNFGNAGVPYQGNNGLIVGGLSNPYLQWEETRKSQLGIDLGFFNDRIMLSTTYQRNRSSNQLLPYQLSNVSGFGSILENFPATVQNTSLEFSLTSTNFKTAHLVWSTNFNLTIPKNKLVEFSNLEQSTYATTLTIGQPITGGKYYHFAGVDPMTGVYQVFDSKGNPTSTPNSTSDLYTLLNRSPKFYGSIENTFSYKTIEMSFSFQFVKQMGLYIYYNNGSQLAPGAFISGNSNQPISVLNRWQQPGSTAPVMKYSTDIGALIFPMSFTQNSDAGFSDASYLRLKNLAISWNAPAKWRQKTRLQGLKLFAQGQNLLTITGYKGADPENQGYTALPPLRVITFGAQISF